MFQHRRKDFDTRVSAIVNHLHAIESELGGIGRLAGQRVSTSAAAAGSQTTEMVGSILNEIADRFRRGQRTAFDEAANLGNKAMRLGTRAGSDAWTRATDQARQYPLLTLAVAVGVGILIGVATHRD